MKNQHFFLLILLLPGGFVQMTFLFVHQSACFMIVLQWTVFVFLLEGKKKNCPVISKPKQRPSPSESVGNQFDMALTSMYTKVLTELDDRKRSTKCWQRNLSQYSLLPVVYYYVFCHNLSYSWRFSQCFGVSEEAPLLQMGFCMNGLNCFNVIAGFRWITILMQTLHQGHRSRVHRSDTKAGSGTWWCLAEGT